MPWVSSRAASHWFEEHPGELRLRVEAPSAEELFIEGGRALAELACGDRAPPAPEGEPWPVRVRSHDHAALLVEWLNELIFRCEAEGKVFTELKVARLTDRDLDAWIRGGTLPGVHVPVKGATLHDLKLSESPQGAAAIIALDV